MSYIDVDESKAITINLIPAQPALVTNVLGGGACFLHALMLSLSSAEYLKKSTDERIEYVHKLRQRLAHNLTLDKFITFLPNSILLGAQRWLGKIITAAITFSKTGRKIDDRFEQVYATIQAPLSPVDVIKVLDVPNFRPHVYAERLNQLGNQRVAEAIEEMVVDLSFKKLQRDLGTYSTEIDDSTFKYIADTLSTLVIFVNDDGSLYRYPITPADMIRYNKAVIINYTTRHYRSIAFENGEKNVRLFKLDDPRIKPLIDEIQR